MLALKDTKKMEPEERDEHAKRLVEITERLDIIDAKNAETKAIHILTGLGFKKSEL